MSCITVHWGGWRAHRIMRLLFCPVPAGFTSEQRELLGPLLKKLSNKLQVRLVS